jgi:hypothetical protein
MFRFVIAALVAAFFMSACNVAEPVGPAPACAAVIESFEARHKAAGHVWRGVATVAPGTVIGGFSDLAGLAIHLLLLAAPGALVPPPDAEEWRFAGYCMERGARHRVYEGKHEVPVAAARSENVQ